MRFGRRPRSRGQMQAVSATNPVPNRGGAVASEERSALLGAPIGLYESDEAKPDMDATDATQQLLTSLGRFQRELTNAVDDSYDGWAEECMNQLIDCVEVALPRGWSEMVEALTDTGRVLQTYENAGRPQGCVDFLNDAYELLCLMVGDLIVDSVRPAVMKQWRERYQKAVARLERDGLVLVTDEGESPTPPQVVPFTGRPAAPSETADDAPFALPDDTVPSAVEDALPTLDELPPLEAVLNGETSESAASAPVESAAEPGKSRGPSRLVVEILDQLCEQLATIEEGEAEASAYAFDRFTGGLRALEREARDDDHAVAVELCELMLRAARRAKTDTGEFRDGLAELGYAFCGAFMNAFREDDLESVADWQVECKGLLSQWESAPESKPAEPAPAAEAREQVVEAPAIPETAEADATVAAEPEEAVDIVVPDTEPDVVIPDEVEATVESPVEAGEPAESVAEPEIEDMTSAGLLEAAQRAAMNGDAAGAKRLALQAAGAIARDEVKSAEGTLRRTKDKLKASLDAMREAREYVGETENAVKEIASSVNEGEVALGKSREQSAQIAQQLSDLREGVAEIERQIAELQERREQELEKVAQTDSQLSAANRTVADTESELQERRAAEAAARTDLETRRQTVNDLQRATGEIETEVEEASTLLDEKQKSYDDITEAIRQICGDPQEKPREEGLLF